MSLRQLVTAAHVSLTSGRNRLLNLVLLRLRGCATAHRRLHARRLIRKRDNSDSDLPIPEAGPERRAPVWLFPATPTCRES